MPEPANQYPDLTATQRRFIEALLLGSSIQGAGEKAGVSERTARRWIKHPAVRAEIKELQRESVDRVLRMLSTLAPQAVDALGRNIRESLPPGVQVQASKILLGQLVALSQFSDLEERLEALEQAANSRRR